MSSATSLLILALSQPVEEDNFSHWQEVILVDEKATETQAANLLELFEERLESLPAEVKNHPCSQRAVYRASITYHKSLLRVTFLPEQAALLREGDGMSTMRAWTYTGPVALRGSFE